MVQYCPHTARARRFSQRAQWGLHLGIERNYNAWKIFDVHSKETVAARDVIFYKRLTLPTYLANLEEDRDPTGGFRGYRAFTSAADEADWDEQNVDEASEEAGPLPYCSVDAPMDDENPRESANAEVFYHFADNSYVTPAEVNTNEAEHIGPNFIPILEEVLTGKWVFCMKTKADGTIDKFKVRWVVRGFDQEHGRDFTETFALVSRHTSLRILFAIAAMKKKKLRQIDVANAFLYAPIDAEILVELPHGSHREPNQSRYTTVFPLAKKSDLTSTLIWWFLTTETICGRHVSCLHSNRGGEFCYGILRRFCSEQGITQSWTLPESPQHNGVAEHCIGLVMEIARTSMIHARAPHFLWPYAVHYAGHQLNLWPCVSRPGASPTSLWTGSHGVASEFRVWGCLALVRDTSVDKLLASTIPCVFLGFPVDSSNYTFYHPPLHRFLDYRAGAIGAGEAGARAAAAGVAAGGGATAAAAAALAAIVSRPLTVSSCLGSYVPPPPPSNSSPAIFSPPRSQSSPPVVPPRRSTPQSVLPSPPESSLTPSTSTPITGYYRATCLVVIRVLASLFTDPRASPSSVLALSAIVAEFSATRHLDYATRVVAAHPLFAKGESALGCDGLKDRHFELEFLAATSSHLCAMLLSPKGDPDALDLGTYREGVSGQWASQWISAMESEMASWRSIGTYIDAVPPPGANVVDGMWIFKVKQLPVFKARYVARGFSQHYELHSVDFSTAFLQGSLHKEIWLHHPPVFTGTFLLGTQWSLRQPVYGLRQAPREWHDTLRTTLVAFGFRPSSADPSLFVHSGPTPFFVLAYVLQRFRLQHSTTQPTPLAVDHRLTGPFPNKPFESSGPYAELVGCLMYLMTCTRPDLAFPLSVLPRFFVTRRHHLVHWTAAVRVAKYLATTSGMGLVLGGTQPVVLTGHCDSSYVDEVETQSSTQVYCFRLGAGAVSWRSTRSSSVASSSAEAEIYAGAMAKQELR
ncbi:unnamed protein product [Closterium sp. NIES-53]